LQLLYQRTWSHVSQRRKEVVFTLFSV
jgi:hypothetical protein